MYITEDIKADIKIMYKLNDIDGALRELVKLNQLTLKDIGDKYFVWYNMGLIYYKRDCEKEANFFTQKIYDELQEQKDVYKLYYNNTLWLHTAINKNKLTIEELKDLYLQIHTYYKMIGSVRNEYGTLSEIYKLEKNKIKMLDLIFQVATNHPKEQELLNGLLKDSKQIDESCYDEALNMLKIFDKCGNNPN